MQQSFLQSREWEKFQEMLGRKIWRVEGRLIIRHDLPGGFNYLYAPHLAELTGSFLREVADVARKEKSIFLKIDPVKNLQPLAVNFQFRKSQNLQPQKTVIADLTKSEEELLGGMHPKTRYNIRLAERKGVYVFKCDRARIKSFVDAFWELLSATSRRDAFYSHSERHYQKLIGISGDQFINNLFFAEYRGEVLAAALVNYYGKRATYLHGASSEIHKNVMAPHLLHWRIMQDAKSSGFEVYDFWGIDEKKWLGVTRFKMGFGGEVVEHPQAVDVIFRPAWYRIYKAVQRVL